jgi:predicted DNA-binding WGR domain protein
MLRYEYIGGSSRKFWEVWPVDETTNGHCWTVRVRYGRLGTAGQTHTKVFSYETAARRYRDEKIVEKVTKGYVLKTKLTEVLKTKLTEPLVDSFSTSTPTYFTSKPKPAKPPCAHVTISRHGAIYKCHACGEKVEFDAPQAAQDRPEFQSQVRRFFDLRPTE